MLRTRVMTALVILPVTLAAVFLAPPLVFKGLIALLFMAGCHEFARISGLSARTGGLLMVLQALIFAALFYSWADVQAHAMMLLTIACAAWLLLFIRLPLYRAGAEPDRTFRVLGFISALIALTTCWFALSWLHEQEKGAFTVFLLLLIIWASDTGAYFSGIRFGRHKLARVISPKKTWEGVYGGIILALIAAWLWSGPVAGLGIEALPLAVITVITTMTSIAGDLYISLHKRTVNLSDAGNLFPGHGGVLDRYDSLLTGAPFFALTFGMLAQ
jgi:phosphatidate cytidylyltransferase